MKNLIFAMAAVMLVACSEPPQPVRLGGQTMGTSWSALVAADVDDPAGLQAELESLLAGVNRAMSTWDPESEISQFNRMAAGCMELSEEFAYVVDYALHVARATDGAYDISVSPLIDLWGFGAPEVLSPPDPAQIAEALQRTGYQYLELDGTRLCKDVDHLEINLSSIAKGYGVDRLAEHLWSLQLNNFLVEIGGDLYVSGDKFGRPWTVAIEQPDSLQRSVAQILHLREVALATSGDYRNFFLLNGRRYSHIIDSRTGYPVENDIASVSVAAVDVTRADAWATALMTLPLERALDLAGAENLAVLFLLRRGEAFEAVSNPAWQAYFEHP